MDRNGVYWGSQFWRHTQASFVHAWPYFPLWWTLGVCRRTPSTRRQINWPKQTMNTSLHPQHCLFRSQQVKSNDSINHLLRIYSFGNTRKKSYLFPKTMPALWIALLPKKKSSGTPGSCPLTTLNSILPTVFSLPTANQKKTKSNLQLTNGSGSKPNGYLFGDDYPPKIV